MFDFVKSVGIGVAAAAAAAAAAIFYTNRARLPSFAARKEKLPTKWVEVGTVDELFLYPLKSGAAIKCTEFLCTSQGPVSNGSRDRVCAVVRNDGKTAVPGQAFPQLTQLAAQVREGVLTLSAPHKLPFSLNLAHLLDAMDSEGVDCGEEAAVYISNYLSAPVRLRFFAHRHHGCDDADKSPLLKQSVSNSGEGIFSEVLPFHLINMASVKELNCRLESPVDGRYFRPNMIISGDKLLPYEEDAWTWVRIGDVVFRVVAPTMRCLQTTVNPDSGEKSKTYEPIKTLRRYRVLRDPAKKALFGGDPVLGVYLSVVGEGDIRIGDTVSVGM